MRKQRIVNMKIIKPPFVKSGVFYFMKYLLIKIYYEKNNKINRK